MSYWRTVTIAIMAWFKIRPRKKRISAAAVVHERDEVKKRNLAVKDINKSLQLYGDIAKAWLMKAIKQPLESIILDPRLNLSIFDQGADNFELQNRMIKIRGKAKAVMNGIIDYTNQMMMSPPLISFLASLFRRGQFIPDNFLSNFE